LQDSPVTNILDRIPVGPPAPKSVMLHYSSEIGNVVVAPHHDAIRPRIERISSAIFNIPGFIAELFDSQEIMQSLTCDARERHLGGEVENDDLSTLLHDLIRGWSR